MAHLYRPVRSHRDDEVLQEELGRWKLFCLTVSMGGLQITWVTVMAGGSPFLLSLGLPPSLVSLVWLAGPICGAFLQPFIGYKSDACTHRWGRRKPFIIYGAVAAIAGMNLLAWTSECTRAVYYILGVDSEGTIPKILTKIAAIIWVWTINASLQPVQCGLRSLAVDSCPASQQVKTSRMASCMTLIGGVAGYACGFLKMPVPESAGWIHNAHFKGLCVIASTVLGVTVAATCAVMGDRPPMEDMQRRRGVKAVYGEIYKTARILPRRIKMVCLVQGFAWLAWFAFLYYAATYLSKLYESTILYTKMGPPSTRFYNALHEESLRHGTLAVMPFSSVALITNISLPYLIQKARVLSLSRVWMGSHILTSICLFALTVVNNFIIASVCVALVGVSWGLTQWAPFAIIGSEIAASMDDAPPSPSSSRADSPLTQSRDLDVDMEKHTRNQSHIQAMTATTMGVHNIAVSMPQMIAAVLSSCIFAVSGVLHIGETDAMAWVLRLSVVAAGCAGWFTRYVD
ncbi:hypothetical protein MW887_005609 [Aspergillus wentii]|nr:hypothetical protein MW887_005609 [Aspergillus wentii]